MNGEAAPAANDASLFRRALLAYRSESGQPLGAWAFIALLNLVVQIAFRRELNPGEFGTLNAALAAIGLLTVPPLAFNQAFTHYLSRPHPADQATRIDSLRAAGLTVTEMFGWIWGAICIILIFTLSPLLVLPRFSLELFTLMTALVAVGSAISGAVCEHSRRLRLWTWLLVSGALVRVIVGAGLSSTEPYAEAGLAAFLIAGFVTVVPALQARETTTADRIAACRAVWDRDFLLCASATLSVLLAVFLFSSADRILAQSWLGGGPGMISVYEFDAYQNAGLITRSILWGTQPILWIVFAERARLTQTTRVSLHFFWLYLVVVLIGVSFFFVAKNPVCSLFCGNQPASFQRLATTADLTAYYLPTLALTMVPLALLQGFGIFSLASRRYPECFVIGVCSIGYALILFFFGRQPKLMPAYMCGASIVSLMILLFVGVIRWGRKQP